MLIGGIPGNGQAFQTWMQFEDMDMNPAATETDPSFANLVCTNSYNYNDIAGSTQSHASSCGKTDMAGAYAWTTSTYGEIANGTGSCNLSGWTSNPVNNIFTVNGAAGSETYHTYCSWQRPFVSSGMMDLKQGEEINFYAGWKQYSRAGSSSSFGVYTYFQLEFESPQMKFIVVDGAAHLALGAVTAALAMLSF